MVGIGAGATAALANALAMGHEYFILSVFLLLKSVSPSLLTGRGDRDDGAGGGSPGVAGWLEAWESWSVHRADASGAPNPGRDSGQGMKEETVEVSAVSEEGERQEITTAENSGGIAAHEEQEEQSLGEEGAGSSPVADDFTLLADTTRVRQVTTDPSRIGRSLDGRAAYPGGTMSELSSRTRQARQNEQEMPSRRGSAREREVDRPRETDQAMMMMMRRRPTKVRTGSRPARETTRRRKRHQNESVSQPESSRSASRAEEGKTMANTKRRRPRGLTDEEGDESSQAGNASSESRTGRQDRTPDKPYSSEDEGVEDVAGTSTRRLDRGRKGKKTQTRGGQGQGQQRRREDPEADRSAAEEDADGSEETKYSSGSVSTFQPSGKKSARDSPLGPPSPYVADTTTLKEELRGARTGILYMGRLAFPPEVNRREGKTRLSLAEEKDAPRHLENLVRDINVDVHSFLDQVQAFDPHPAGLKRGLALLVLASSLLPSSFVSDAVSFMAGGSEQSEEVQDARLGILFFGFVFLGMHFLRKFLVARSRRRSFQRSLSRVRGLYKRKMNLALKDELSDVLARPLTTSREKERAGREENRGVSGATRIEEEPRSPESQRLFSLRGNEDSGAEAHEAVQEGERKPHADSLSYADLGDTSLDVPEEHEELKTKKQDSHRVRKRALSLGSRAGSLAERGRQQQWRVRQKRPGDRRRKSLPLPFLKEEKAVQTEASNDEDIPRLERSQSPVFAPWWPPPSSVSSTGSRVDSSQGENEGKPSLSAAETRASEKSAGDDHSVSRALPSKEGRRYSLSPATPVVEEELAAPFYGQARRGVSRSRSLSRSTSQQREAVAQGSLVVPSRQSKAGAPALSTSAEVPRTDGVLEQSRESKGDAKKTRAERARDGAYQKARRQGAGTREEKLDHADSLSPGSLRAGSASRKVTRSHGRKPSRSVLVRTQARRSRGRVRQKRKDTSSFVDDMSEALVAANKMEPEEAKEEVPDAGAEHTAEKETDATTREEVPDPPKHRGRRSLGSPPENWKLAARLHMAKAELMEQVHEAAALRNLQPLDGLAGVLASVSALLFAVISLASRRCEDARQVITEPTVLLIILSTLVLSAARLRGSLRRREAQNALLVRRRQEKAHRLMEEHAAQHFGGLQQQRIQSREPPLPEGSMRSSYSVTQGSLPEGMVSGEEETGEFSQGAARKGGRANGYWPFGRDREGQVSSSKADHRRGDPALEKGSRGGGGTDDRKGHGSPSQPHDWGKKTWIRRLRRKYTGTKNEERGPNGQMPTNIGAPGQQSVERHREAQRGTSRPGLEILRAALPPEHARSYGMRPSSAP